MKKEVLKYRKINIFILIALFVTVYAIVIIIFEILNRLLNLGVGLFIAQIVSLYIYLMFILRTQLHSYELHLQEDQLIVKEFLSKREKTLVAIAYSSIESISKEQKHKDSYYHKKRKIIKKHIKNTKLFYIEYDDFIDISLIKLQCSDSFIEELTNRVGRIVNT